MANRLQIFRSSTTGNRPANGIRQTGEPYVNFADGQFGVVNATQVPQDLIGVRFFSTTATYAKGDHAVYSGALYKATVAVSPGAFNPSQWTSIGGSVTVSDTSPANPQPGNLWFDSLDGQLYVYYNDGNSSQWVVAVTNLAAPYVAGSSEGGFVNKFRNAIFEVWQRGTAVGPIAASGSGYTADGWLLNPVGAALSGNQGVFSGAGYPLNIGSSYFSLHGAAGMTAFYLSQRIESLVAAPLNNRTMTFSAWVSCTIGFTPQLLVLHPTATDNYASTVTDIPLTNMQPVPANTWVRVAYTFTLPDGVPLSGFQVSLYCPVVLTSAQFVSIAACDLRATPGLPVGLCTNSPPPELRPIHEELAFCQRYFQASSGLNIFGGYVVSGGSYQLAIPFLVQMRIAPPSSAISITDGGVSAGFSAGPATFGNSYAKGFTVYKSATAQANGAYFVVNWTASAEL